MVGHAKKCVERYCELANKTTQQLYEVSTSCIVDLHFKEEETKSVGELMESVGEMTQFGNILVTQRSKSNTSTPKTNSQTFWPKEIPHVMSHLLCLFNISHFSSTVCSDTLAKRSQQDSREERVTATSRPMMNHIARTPSFVSSSTSVSQVKKHYGSQDPWKSIAGEDRSGRPGRETDLFEASDHYHHEQFMESHSSTDYSKLDYNSAWSCQGWKTETTTYDWSGRPGKTSWRIVRKVRPDHEEILLDGTAQSVKYGETLGDRSGRPENFNSQEVANSQNSVVGNDETKLELSGESRSFVNRVN